MQIALTPLPKLLFFGLLIFAGLFFYNNYFKKKSSLVVGNYQIISAPIQVKHNFKCDGRKYCSQMKSRAEAVFYIRNCPNTKMDGDYDGIPCENDSRF
ncbi:MAG: excalibur calcium-binding domain-containing protein [Enterobacterales bacterium]|nr:excalibur calcium-binding domain-containing protein [Enterobacterales bacterium]